MSHSKSNNKILNFCETSHIRRDLVLIGTNLLLSKFTETFLSFLVVDSNFTPSKLGSISYFEEMAQFLSTKLLLEQVQLNWWVKTSSLWSTFLNIFWPQISFECVLTAEWEQVKNPPKWKSISTPLEHRSVAAACNWQTFRTVWTTDNFPLILQLYLCKNKVLIFILLL